jgi:hypothetical protein
MSAWQVRLSPTKRINLVIQVLTEKVLEDDNGMMLWLGFWEVTVTISGGWRADGFEDLQSDFMDDVADGVL